jgi:hypothetical protein
MEVDHVLDTQSEDHGVWKLLRVEGGLGGHR